MSEFTRLTYFIKWACFLSLQLDSVRISEVVGGRARQEVAIKNLEYPRAQDLGQAQWGPRKKSEKVHK